MGSIRDGILHPFLIPSSRVGDKAILGNVLVEPQDMARTFSRLAGPSAVVIGGEPSSAPDPIIEASKHLAARPSGTRWTHVRGGFLSIRGECVCERVPDTSFLHSTA